MKRSRTSKPISASCLVQHGHFGTSDSETLTSSILRRSPRPRRSRLGREPRPPGAFWSDGLSPSLGGASPSLGGASPSLGGASPSLGGASPSLGGAPPSAA